ncbi:MAG: class I SAM-dependent methyltransferase [Actinomycetota bacterium]
MNTEAWDRIAAKSPLPPIPTTVAFGADLPADDDLRLCGEVTGKRVLDLGCGAGENAVVLAGRGAHVIAVDASAGRLAAARRLADAAEVRVEWHQSDASDLAFLRADSIDLALATGLLGEVDDLDRLLRQVHRVLRPGAPLVFSFDHPVALCVARDDAEPGSLPLGAREVRRSWFDGSPCPIRHAGEEISVIPRTIASIFASLHRAGYRTELLLEPEPMRSDDPGPILPTTVVWRARKEGV